MTKKEARARQAELKYRIENHLDVIKRLNDEMSGIEAIISKKDDWRDKVTYLTPEQNQLISNKMQLMQEMHAFAHVRNEGWLPDWESGYMDRYGVVREEHGTFKVRCRISYNDFVFGLAVKSLEIAEEMFEEFGERISEVYNKQY